MGSPVPASEFLDLGELRVSSGKVLTVWAAEGDLDADATVSNTFALEWPPRSDRTQEFPEFDRSAWFPVDVARVGRGGGRGPGRGRRGGARGRGAGARAGAG